MASPLKKKGFLQTDQNTLEKQQRFFLKGMEIMFRIHSHLEN